MLNTSSWSHRKRVQAEVQSRRPVQAHRVTNPCHSFWMASSSPQRCDKCASIAALCTNNSAEVDHGASVGLMLAQEASLAPGNETPPKWGSMWNERVTKLGLLGPLIVVGLAPSGPLASLDSDVGENLHSVFVLATRAMPSIIEVAVDALTGGRMVAGLEGQQRGTTRQHSKILE